MIRSIVVFYSVALGIATVVPLVMRAKGIGVTDGSAGLIILLAMWAPAVGRFVATRTVDREWVSPFPFRRWGRPRGWVFGWPFLAIIVIYLMAYTVGVLLGWSEWAPRWQGPLKIAVNLLFNVPIVIAIGLFGSVGEELGWRGYLQPKLDHAGVRGSVFIVVVLELIFHLPIILIAGYLDTAGSLWVIPLFFAAKLGASFVWAHGCYAMMSVWPAFWFHAIHNGLSQSIFPRFFTGGDDHLLLGESGLLPTLGYLVMAGIIMFRMRRKGQNWADLSRMNTTP
jgi:membrane protease YdiL (CAAX protease family)